MNDDDSIAVEIADLPDDCLCLIFSQLSGADASRAMAVCTLWRRLVAEARLHVRFSGNTTLTLPEQAMRATLFPFAVRVGLHGGIRARPDATDTTLTAAHVAQLGRACTYLRKLTLRDCSAFGRLSQADTTVSALAGMFAPPGRRAAPAVVAPARPTPEEERAQRSAELRAQHLPVIKALVDLRALTNLRLEACGVTDDAVDVILHLLPRLTHLALNKCARLTPAVLRVISERGAALEVLRLVSLARGTSPVDAEDVVMDSYARSYQTSVHTPQAIDLRELRNLPALRKLDLSDTSLPADTGGTLVKPWSIPVLGQLESLSLSAANVTEGVLCYVCGQLTKLRHLDVSFVQEAARAFSRQAAGGAFTWPFMSNLVSLHLHEASQNMLEGLLALAPQLKKLTLQYAGVPPAYRGPLANVFPSAGRAVLNELRELRVHRYDNSVFEWLLQRTPSLWVLSVSGVQGNLRWPTALANLRLPELRSFACPLVPSLHVDSLSNLRELDLSVHGDMQLGNDAGELARLLRSVLKTGSELLTWVDMSYQRCVARPVVDALRAFKRMRYINLRGTGPLAPRKLRTLFGERPSLQLVV